MSTPENEATRTLGEAPKVTLAQFFDLSAKALNVQQRIEEAASSGASVLGAALAAAPDPLRGAVASSLAKTLESALSTPLIDIFAKAWNYRRDLVKFCDLSKYPPDRTVDYDLKENAIDAKFKPGIQLALNDAAIGPVVEFEIIAKLVSSPVLKIREARIVAARIGKLHGEGKISCQGFVLAERKGGALQIPGEITFGDGFPIGKPRSADTLDSNLTPH